MKDVELRPDQSLELQSQTKHKIECVLRNVRKTEESPCPVIISSNDDTPEQRNELVLSIKNCNQNDAQLVLKHSPSVSRFFEWFGGHQYVNTALDSYISIDFSDFVHAGQQPLISMSCDKRGFEFVRVSKVQEKLGEIVEQSKTSVLEQCIWLVKYTGSDDFELEPNETLNIKIHGLATTQRPSLRYVDISWKEAGDVHTKTAFTQVTIQLLRPANFVQPPFPLQSYWLDNHRDVYISNESNEIENELRFGISNVGLGPLKLDCRENVLEGPYFELVFLGGQGTGDITRDRFLKDIQLEIDDESYGDEWSHHKMIQGPVVTWRIQPELYNKDGERNKQILGVEESGTITFKLSQLFIFGHEGVSMIYLKYYNIPDFDDNQLVLFTEKSKLEGSIPSAGLERDMLNINGAKNAIIPPLRWKIEDVHGNYETKVVLGEKVNVQGEIRENHQLIPPVGTIMLFAGQKKDDNGTIIPPKGWCLCDGSFVGITQYPELFEVFGSAFEIGTGYFAIPYQPNIQSNGWGSAKISLSYIIKVGPEDKDWSSDGLVEPRHETA